jgi:hypothetical protein
VFREPPSFKGLSQNSTELFCLYFV